MRQISRFIRQLGQAIMEEGKEIFENPKHRTTMGNSIINDLVGENNKEYIPPRQHTKETIFLSRILHGVGEIVTCNENLKHFPLFVRTFPYSKHQIPRLTYLRYHVGNYLNEIYILQCRLESFLTVLERLYRKSQRRSLLNSYRQFRVFVKRSFSGIVRTRGYDVHRQRIECPLWNRLQLMELFMASKDIFGDSLKKLYKPVFTDVRRTHLDEIRKNERIIEKLVAGSFKLANDLVFNKDGKVHYPWAN